MKTLTALQARKLDFKATGRFGMPVALLMENAGRAVSREVLKVIGRKKLKVAVICGKGNNGGDGFSAARHLMAKGIDVDIYLCGKISEVKEEAKANLDILLRLKKKIFIVNKASLKRFKRRLSGYGLIVDSILGVGLRGNVKGVILEVINIINQAGAPVLSVDLPSGMDADTGGALGAAVKADSTITFIAPKKGMVKLAGRKLCGHIVVSDIGFPFLL